MKSNAQSESGAWVAAKLYYGTGLSSTKSARHRSAAVARGLCPCGFVGTCAKLVEPCADGGALRGAAPSMTRAHFRKEVGGALSPFVLVIRLPRAVQR